MSTPPLLPLPRFAPARNLLARLVSYSVRTPYPLLEEWLSARSPEGATKASSVRVLRVSDFAFIGVPAAEWQRRHEVRISEGGTGEKCLNTEKANAARRCPYCEGPIRAAAIYCHHCCRNVPAAPGVRGSWDTLHRYRIAEMYAMAWVRERVSRFAVTIILLGSLGLLAVCVLLSRQIRPTPFTVPAEPPAAVVRAQWQADTARRIREQRGAFFANHPELWEAAAREGWIVRGDR